MLNKLLSAVVASSIILGASVAVANEAAQNEKMNDMTPAAGMEHKDCKSLTGDEKKSCMKDMKKMHGKKMEKKDGAMQGEMKQ